MGLPDYNALYIGLLRVDASHQSLALYYHKNKKVLNVLYTM